MGLGDMIGSALGGGEKPPRTKAASVAYFQSNSLGGDDDGGGSVSANNDNTVDKGLPLDFIHFGRVHGDFSLNFHHNSLSDDKRADFGGEGDGIAGEKSAKNFKAMMFRGGVEREAILLSAVIASAQAVIKECDENKGALGEVMDAVGSLLGGGGGDKGPDPAEFDDILSDISLAGGAVNKSSIHYKDIHKAGKDLRQYRCDYGAIVQKFTNKYMKPSSPGGGMIPLAALSGPLQTIQGIAFKAFDVYAASFFCIREDVEGKIIKACHSMTIEAIEERYTRVFPIWFFRWSDNVPPEKKTDADGNIVEETVEKVNEEINKVKSEVDEKKKSVQDFLGIDNDEHMAGEKYLKEIFGAMAGGGGDKQEKEKTDQEKKEAGGAPGKIVKAFTKVVGPLPGFVTGIIIEIASANLGMMDVIYRKLLLDIGEAPIDEEFLIVAGREYLSHRMINILAKMSGLGFLQEGSGPLLGLPGIGGVGGEQIKNRLARIVDSVVMSQIESIISIAMKDLHGKLEGARSDAAQAKSVTMEVFLGRLPWFYALMFRNTFFPLWDIIVEKVFGTIGGPLGSITSPAKGLLGDAKSAIADAGKVAKSLEKIDAAKVMQATHDPMGALGLGGGDTQEEAPPVKFPGSPREPMAEGTPVSEDEVKEAEAANIVVKDPDKDEEW
ncbi:MAG: hypothetical protein KKC76_18960 [Proteobacteria bacterium]|nr:hypothetical protein [Pseudomonadota bacterium]MBU4296526.1 hypothetical protein [Pseudomonadota bacterium]MCG2746907.1 hypothetical protein [Desulfobulbaceae bacterium]